MNNVFCFTSIDTGRTEFKCSFVPLSTWNREDCRGVFNTPKQRTSIVGENSREGYPELSQLAQRSLIQSKGPKKTHSKTLTSFFRPVGDCLFLLQSLSAAVKPTAEFQPWLPHGRRWMDLTAASLPTLRTQQHLGCSPRLDFLCYAQEPPILLSPQQACCLSKLLSPRAAKWNKKAGTPQTPSVWEGTHNPRMGY